jgi:multidrug efflux pump subunit AcrA (membrane-fusion protein)
MPGDARRLLRAGLAVAVLGGVGYGIWYWVESRHRVWTDDANVEGAVVIVSARVPGPVARVLVRDNEEVREGQVLVEIDPRDYEIRVQQARAALAMAAADERAARTEVPLTRDTAASRIEQARAAAAAARVAVEVGRAQVVAGRLVNRVDPRWLVSAGAAVIAYSPGLMASLNLTADFWTLVWSRFVQGVGMGLVFVPLTTMTLSPVAPARMATATGLYNVVRNLGGSAGIAVLATLLSRQTQVHQASLVGRVTVWDPATADRLERLERAFAAAGADAHTAHLQALGRLYGDVQRQATMRAFVDDFWLLTLLFAAFVPLVWLMHRPADPTGRREALGPVEAA